MAPANSQDGVSPYFSKHPEDLQRFPATLRIFNSVLGVWKWVQIRFFKSSLIYCLSYLKSLNPHLKYEMLKERSLMRPF